VRRERRRQEHPPPRHRRPLGRGRGLHRARAPADNSFFLPQKPYLCLGTLPENVEYPKPPSKPTSLDTDRSAEIALALGQVGLGHLIERHGLDSEVDFDSVLSGGEKQRLGFARLLRPEAKFAILDEATSALDPENEELVYRLLAERVASYVSVGHRAALERFHSHGLRLERRPAGATGTMRRLAPAPGLDVRPPAP